MKTLLEAGAAALSVFGASSQNNRLVRMMFPRGDGPLELMGSTTVYPRTVQLRLIRE